MVLTQDLIQQGFLLSKTVPSDLADYLIIKKICYQKYVHEYFGGWDDDVQVIMNTHIFNQAIEYTVFQKMMLFHKTAGFFSYDEQEDRIGGISIQMLPSAQNKGMGSFYLQQIIIRSKQVDKPVFLKVFKSNPAQYLYKKFGFTIAEESLTHYFMQFIPAVE